MRLHKHKHKNRWRKAALTWDGTEFLNPVTGPLLHFTFHLTSLWKHELLQIHHLSICTQAGLLMKSFCNHTDPLPVYHGRESLSMYKTQCLLHEMENKTKQPSHVKISPNHVRAETHINTEQQQKPRNQSQA